MTATRSPAAPAGLPETPAFPPAGLPATPAFPPAGWPAAPAFPAAAARTSTRRAK